MSQASDPTLGMHRTGGPSTSRSAATAILSKKTALQRLVLAKLLEAGPAGLTDYELEERCDNHGSTFRTRRSELVDQKLVIDSGQKRRIAGRLRIVWRIRTDADDTGDLVDQMSPDRRDPIDKLLGRGFQSEFTNIDEIENYVRDNGFQIVGHFGTESVYKTPRGHQFSFDRAASPLIGTLSYEEPAQNITLSGLTLPKFTLPGASPENP